ncbi:hypothetical protein [Chryseobacterium sp. JUb7]|nr:hypothetical protein [Chryseobacterium sp. JUb7]MCS3529585.1 hypothetical protein [Chryseobacterium sp. JUb7]
MKNSNLKKLSRKAQQLINGGSLKKCKDHSQCSIGWCCGGTCVEIACIEP